MVLIFHRLLFVELPGRHADGAAANALGGKLLVGANAELHLGAGAHNDDLGRSLAIGDGIGATLQAFGRGVLGAIEGGQRLAAEREHYRLMLELHDHAPGLGDLVGIGGTQIDEPRHRTQR